jgi:HEAT repeat protein
MKLSHHICFYWQKWMLLQIAVLLIAPFVLLAAPGIMEEEGIRRVHAHLLLKDYDSALREAQELYESFPGSSSVGSAYIEALSASGYEMQALEIWDRLSTRHSSLLQNNQLLEALSWGMLRKALESNQYAIRLSALIGAYITRDVRAVPFLLRSMRDSNAVIRSVAVRMAADFGDAVLKDELIRLMSDEKIWFVRLEVIKTAGNLRMQSLAPRLKAILTADKNTLEERQFAIEALIQIYDRISLEEIIDLAHSNRAPMRQLACQFAVHFQVKEAKDEVIQLAFDSHPAVRIAALNAIGLLYRNEMPAGQITEIASRLFDDSNPAVSITAAWLAALGDPSVAEAVFLRWVCHDSSENRRLAAAAIAATGDRCIALARQTLEESEDLYVQVNIALGLIGQRVEVARSCDAIYEFLNREKRMWMWDDRPNRLFTVLAPSQVRHSDQIPNYPQAIDQMTRLDLLSVMALVEDPRAQEAIKTFLQNKSWGITGVAAAMLVKEGDSSALDAVRNLVEDPNPDVRLQACLVLSMSGHDSSVVLTLQKAYSEADHDRKRMILEALSQVGDIESLPFLISVLKEPFQIFRVMAAACIIRLM